MCFRVGDTVVDEKNMSKHGLNNHEVEERIKKGLVHSNTDVPTKTIPQIILGNTCTLFNFLNFGLGLAILLVGSYKNLLFLGVVFCNLLISTIQEIRAKRIVDSLSLFHESKVKAIRNGQEVMLRANEIVLDDVLKLSLGNQVLVDSVVLDGSCLVNESFITGEEDPVLKREGDTLLSGSFIVSGMVFARVIHVGEDNYTSKISKDAKYLKKVNSVLMRSLNQIIKVLSFVVIPIGLLLFWSQMRLPGASMQTAVVQTVAGLIGMIPDGLVLLTSTVLAVSVIRLSKYRVLVQELYCIETLARVDLLCLDKTGTITEGKMHLDKVIPVSTTISRIDTILQEMCRALEDSTPTMNAVREQYPGGGNWQVLKRIPFSSDKKYSLVTFQTYGTFVLGAPEFVLDAAYLTSTLKHYQASYRVLVLAERKGNHNVLLGFLLLKDVIRKEAQATLRYFQEQGVQIKIISGDNPVTVSKIAGEVGVPHSENYIDLSHVTDEDLSSIGENYTIFGRVSPLQKKQLILALQRNGHTVGMMGDGVNDVLALKTSDCAITVASGMQAAKNVSQLVLLNDNFDAMPRVVEEGRRTINNIERSATLFLVKTIYASALAVLFLFLPFPYPFQPIQLSLTNMVIIGIPSFILALEKNQERVRGNFLTNVLSRAFPVALTILTNILFALFLGQAFSFSPREISTVCVFAVFFAGYLLLLRLCRPWNRLRVSLAIVMLLIFLCEVFFLGDLFSLASFDLRLVLFTVAIFSLTFLLFGIYHDIYGWIQKKWRHYLKKRK